MYKLENYNNQFLTFSAISLSLRSRNFSVNFRKMFFLSIFLQPHLLKFGHRLGVNRRHFLCSTTSLVTCLLYSSSSLLDSSLLESPLFLTFLFSTSAGFLQQTAWTALSAIEHSGLQYFFLRHLDLDAIICYILSFSNTYFKSANLAIGEWSPVHLRHRSKKETEVAPCW